MKSLSEKIDAMTAEGLRQHHEDRKRLDEMTAEGLRQHQQHYRQIEAMTAKALLEVKERERVLQNMRKEIQRQDNIRKPPVYRTASRPVITQREKSELETLPTARSQSK